MQLDQNTIPDEIGPDEKLGEIHPNAELEMLIQLGGKVRSKVYKKLLKVLVYKVEMSHLVILIASLGLLLRGNSFVDHISLLKNSDFSFVSQASAESAPAKEVKPEVQATESKKEQSKVEEAPAKNDVDPLLLDENQIKVLLALAKKGKNIKETEQEADMEKQKKIVELAQENLNKRIGELEKVKKDIDSKKDELTKDEKQNLLNMAKIYETMKPAQAADILNKLELTSVTQLIKHMNQKKAAAIVAAMDASKARLLTLEIIRSKDVEGKYTPESPKMDAAGSVPPGSMPAAAPVSTPASAPAEIKAPEGVNPTLPDPTAKKA